MGSPRSTSAFKLADHAPLASAFAMCCSEGTVIATSVGNCSRTPRPVFKMVLSFATTALNTTPSTNTTATLRATYNTASRDNITEID